MQKVTDVLFSLKEATAFLCLRVGIHILKSSEVLTQSKVSAVSSSTRIVESRDKGFVLDLKLLFTIVDCFSGRFPPRFFYCETSLFNWFFWIIIFCLIYFYSVT